MKQEQTITARFTEAVLDGAKQAEEQWGCRMTRLVQNVQQQGAQAYLKMLLARNRRSDAFDRLADLGHLECSMEAIAVRGCFGALFTDEEINTCLLALLENGYYT